MHTFITRIPPLEPRLSAFLRLCGKHLRAPRAERHGKQGTNVLKVKCRPESCRVLSSGKSGNRAARHGPKDRRITASARKPEAAAGIRAGDVTVPGDVAVQLRSSRTRSPRERTPSFW